MLRRFSAAAICLVGWVLSATAAADRVHLVGGSVIEGKATRDGDKIVIELAGGSMAVEAVSVERIERSESDVDRFEQRYAQLGNRDVAGRMALADFCRDRGLHAREQRMLREVIELAPDHAQARARLGYVRENGTWISREERLRAQGMVEHEGQWITREQLLELERLRAQAEQAEHAREQAALEVEAKRAELEAKRREPAGSAASAVGPPAAAIVVDGSPYPYPYPYFHPPPVFLPPHVLPPRPRPRPPIAQPSCGAPPCPEQRPRQPRMNPHVRDPSEYF